MYQFTKNFISSTTLQALHIHPHALLPGRLDRPPECMFGVSSSSAPSFIPRSPTPDICCLFPPSPPDDVSGREGEVRAAAAHCFWGCYEFPPFPLLPPPLGAWGARVDSASSSSSFWPCDALSLSPKFPGLREKNGGTGGRKREDAGRTGQVKGSIDNVFLRCVTMPRVLIAICFVHF